MNGWTYLWAGVLITALTLFTGLSIAVTIGGFLDIRKLLRSLKRTHHENRDGG